MRKDANVTKGILYKCQKLSDYQEIDIIKINEELGGKEKLFRNKNAFLGGNDNIKFEVFDLPRLITCPGSTEICRKNCYQIKITNMHKGENQDSASTYHKKYNLVCSMQDDFINRIVSEIKSKRPSDNRQNFIRIHADGDFYSEEYLIKWMTIALVTKLLFENKYRFVVYTKSFRILDNVLSCNDKLRSIWENACNIANINEASVPNEISLADFNLRIIASVMDDTNIGKMAIRKIKIQRK